MGIGNLRVFEFLNFDKDEMNYLSWVFRFFNIFLMREAFYLPELPSKSLNLALRNPDLRLPQRPPNRPSHWKLRWVSPWPLPNRLKSHYLFSKLPLFPHSSPQILWKVLVLTSQSSSLLGGKTPFYSSSILNFLLRTLSALWMALSPYLLKYFVFFVLERGRGHLKGEIMLFSREELRFIRRVCTVEVVFRTLTAYWVLPSGDQ